MFFYYLIFLFILLFSFSKDKKFNVVFSIIIFAFFYLLSFIRWECGTDWDSYYSIFLNADKKPIYQEKLFSILNILIRKRTDNFSVLLCIEGLIIFLCMARSYNFFSDCSLIPILAYFALNRGYIFFIRQHIAICLCIVSALYILKNKLLLSLIFIVLATLFHISALVFLPAIILSKVRLSNKLIVVLIILACMFSLLLDKILKLFTQFPSGYILYKFTRYGNDGDNLFGMGGGLSKSLIIIKSLFNRSFILILLFICRKKNRENKKFNFIFNCTLINNLIFISFSSLSLALTRMGLFYAIFEIFAYPYIFKISNKKYFQTLILFFMVIYLLLRLNNGLMSVYDAYIPYRYKLF